MSNNDIETLTKKIIDEEVVKLKWQTSDTFYEIKKLSIDQRGRVGEHLLRDAFEKFYKTNYIDNKKGDWDIEIKNFKIEVKLATLDVKNKFQHEGIKSSKIWDIVAFVDVAPNDLYITFIHKDKFNFNGKGSTVELNGVNQSIHFRAKDGTAKRATGAGYKVDFKLTNLSKIDSIDSLKEAFDNTISNI